MIFYKSRCHRDPVSVGPSSICPIPLLNLSSEPHTNYFWSPSDGFCKWLSHILSFHMDNRLWKFGVYLIEVCVVWSLGDPISSVWGSEIYFGKINTKTEYKYIGCFILAKHAIVSVRFIQNRQVARYIQLSQPFPNFDVFSCIALENGKTCWHLNIFYNRVCLLHHRMY